MDRIHELLEEICGDNYSEEWLKINYKKIPVTAINASIGTEKKFNELYKELFNDDKYTKIKRTKSGGISIKSSFTFFHHYAFDVRVSCGCIELTVCTPFNDQMRSYRIQYRNANYKEEKSERFISGEQSFRIFQNEVAKDGIDLEDYAVEEEEGMKLNEEITPPDIALKRSIWRDRTFEHVYHLDFHKFYMSGLKLSHPELAPAIDRMAQRAKHDPRFKTAMAATIGYMHSKVCGYRYTRLSKDGINKAYQLYYEVMRELEQEHMLIATNTDGMWYTGPEFHGIYEGPNLGEWQNDYKDCTIRFKSAGSYEFIEDGVYHPVVRGRTQLDKIVPREKWEWGDIYDPKAELQVFSFKKGEGVVWQILNA